MLPKHLERKSIEAVELQGDTWKAWHAVMLRWAELESKGRLKKANEETLKGQFLNEVFGQALGYVFLSANAAQWHLRPEYAVNGGTADAAIGIFSPNQETVPRALVEVKGPNVDLDRDRSQGRTPVQQLWDYLYSVPNCPWGILTNMVSFRLYHRSKTPYYYEHFALQGLTEERAFRKFYVLFSRQGLLAATMGQRPWAEVLLADAEARQKEVGGDLYKVYSAERQSLIDHLRAKHGKTTDASIRIAQKLLDRIIFIAFCEDRKLLPERTIERAWKNGRPFALVTNPKWSTFLELFRSIDQGNPAARIEKYNGGLFRKDPEVDDLQLEDKWTNVFKDVADYDFRDEVNVDVLGHLFERSVTELEAIRSSAIPAGPSSGTKAVGRRKSEGIYYTPSHITRYIVENTIGRCLKERFAALARKHGVDPDAAPKTSDLVRWVQFQMEKLGVLRRLRVCDPACGSGAFLIQAYDYLEDVYEGIASALAAHQVADGAALGAAMSETILRENLFGVDLSAEAVEITQLALWIRTARRGKTLADLSQNILCGNSLVDDPKVDGRAFDWPARFARVFAAGGFDCVISNPPYVKLQNFRKREPRIAKFLVERYRSAKTGNFDMYLPFIERGLKLLAADGRMGYIAPSVWLFNEYGRGLRELAAERRALERFVDFKSHQVFADATTYTALQFFRGSPQESIEAGDASDGRLQELRFHRATYAGRGSAPWAFMENRDQEILDAMRGNSVTLADATEQIFQGLITSADAVYHLIRLSPGMYYSKALEREVELEDEIMKPLVSGEEAVPFATPRTDTYLLFPYYVTREECRLLSAKELGKQYKRAWAYLRGNEKTLRARESAKFDDEEWWRFGRNQSIDKQERPKLLVPRLLLDLFASGDPFGQVYLDNVDVGGVLAAEGWDIHYLLGVLNSKACNFVWRMTSKPFRGEYRSANKQFIAPLPIPRAKKQEPIASLARRLAELHGKRLDAEAKVHRRFVTDLPQAQLIQTSPLPPSLSGKLRGFADVSLGVVIEEMEKFAKRRFKPTERANWDEYLTAETIAIQKLQRKIADAEAELNERVYKLYGLSAAQIAVIDAEGASRRLR